MQNISNNILWYNNPIILFKNLDQFYPYSELKYYEKINSIARLAIYLIIIINVLSLKKEWYIISLGLLILSYYYSIKNPNLIINNDLTQENITNKIIINDTNNQEEFINCSNPTLNNPFMNYTLGEHYISTKNESNRKHPACSYEDVKIDMRNKFRSTINTDTTDIWGRYISDRNFYTMPNTGIVNNQVEFAKWCYNSINSGECKTYGSNCTKYRNPKYHIGRYSY